MAHRLAFPPNAIVPLAVKIAERGTGRLNEADETQADLELLALDATPIDGMHQPTRDTLWMKAAFIDPLGRRVEVRAHSPVPGSGAVQRFGGVATNQLRFLQEESEPVWLFEMLQAWGRCDIRVNDALTDSNVMGVVTLSQPLVAGSAGPADSPRVTLEIQPQRVEHDLSLAPCPLRAASELGMEAWTIVWEDVEFAQAPVMSVRVEKGDTPEKVARELSVDAEAVVRANAHLALERVEPGDLIRVPMLVRAKESAPKKVHPSVALTWQEIIRGWTTLN